MEEIEEAIVILSDANTEIDPAAAKARRGGPTDNKGATGPIPEDNLPGHRPEHDQDKPEGPPPA